MSWNYRILRHDPLIPGRDEPWYAVHEVYYDGGGIVGWTEKPVAVSGESVEEVMETLVKMACAIGKPVLRAEDLPGAK